MTIRNKDHYTAALWDWGFLDDCFKGTGIRVSDVDGIVERRGEFLVIEAKSPGATVPTGQRIMFSQLSKRKGFTVLTVWGHDNDPQHVQIWRPGQYEPSPLQPASIGDIREYVSRWYEWADNRR